MSASEYDPLIPESAAAGAEDLERVRREFAAASRPYLRSPLPWAAWAVILPTAALLTERALGSLGPAGVLGLWSAAILLGGGVEAVAILRGGRGRGTTPLAAWTLRIQGNLSLVALALSLLLLWQEAPAALPGVWLLLLGHSFYVFGGFAFPPLKVCGLLYQAGGVAALWPGAPPLEVFAGVVAAGNLWVAAALWRRRQGPRT